MKNLSYCRGPHINIIHDEMAVIIHSLKDDGFYVSLTYESENVYRDIKNINFPKDPDSDYLMMVLYLSIKSDDYKDIKQELGLIKSKLEYLNQRYDIIKYNFKKGKRYDLNPYMVDNLENDYTIIRIYLTNCIIRVCKHDPNIKIKLKNWGITY